MSIGESLPMNKATKAALDTLTSNPIIAVPNRRGRPRKFPLIPKTSSPSASLQTHQPNPFDKPREERSYKDFFPDLDIKEPLDIIAVPSSHSSLQSHASSLDLTDTTATISAEKTALVPASAPITEEHDTISEDRRTVLKLPVPSFQKINPIRPTKSKKEDKHVVLFERPEHHYIRYIEPTEIELFNTVEYDMDEQDEVWLQIYNKERKKEGLGLVTGELFEAIIDQLEKEWFNLIKNLPKKTTEEPVLPEDTKCAVCDDGECENSNAIVFCDGCNLAVHQDCYGIPYIPEGQWLCRKCMVSPENPVSCIFCPWEGGAFKQTTTNQWGHLLCAVWIPEVGLSNSVYMEPIDNIENVPKSRWKLNCYICRRRHGACIQCDNKHCFVAFHVTCARWARLCMRMKLHGTHYDGVVLKAYCDRHTPRDYRDTVDVDTNLAAAQQWFVNHKRIMPRRRYIDEEHDEVAPERSAKGQKQSVTQLLPTSKAARAHQHQYTAGAPIAPEYIVDKLENLPCVHQSKLKKKNLMIASICRYWSLKRESRRGAPLLKRLHLEPWTASSTELKQTEVEKAQKASSMMSLRADLERVRMLTEQVQKRERHKLDRLRKQKTYLETILYPLEFILTPILRQLMEMDKKEFFRYPVTLELASDYYDIIKEPISFADIIEKLTSHKYTTLESFKHDISLIWKNCMTYNKRETLYYKVAQRMEKKAEELIAQAYIDYDSLKFQSNSGVLDVDIDPSIFEYGTETTAQEKELVSDLVSTSSLSSNILSSSTRSDSNSSNSSNSSNNGRSETSVDTRRRVASSESSDTSKWRAAKGSEVRVTRSASVKNKRSLRSRPAANDTHHTVKPKSTSPSKRKRALSPLPKEESTPSSKKAKIEKKPTDNKDAKKDASSNELPPPSSSKPAAVKYKDGEFVWARVRGFPPHPAKIIDPKSKKRNIPEKVLASQNKEKKEILVEFFEVNDSHIWGWIEKSEIHPFGYLEMDLEMLGQAKKCRKPFRIREVRKGYIFACDLVHIDPKPALLKVFKH